MNPWTKVIMHPLGLAGFALFLLFSYLGRLKKGDKRRWMAPSAIIIGVVALAGGLFLSYIQISSERPAPVEPSTKIATPSQQQTNQVRQSTTGAGSPAVQGVQGDVTITVDQSSGSGKPQKPAEKKPKEPKE